MVAQVVGDSVYLVSDHAMSELVKGTRQISGVSVIVRAGSVPTETSILVVVPDMFGAVANKVYELEVQIRKKYKHSRLNLEVQSRDVYELETQAIVYVNAS